MVCGGAIGRSVVQQETLNLCGFFGLEASMLVSHTKVREFKPDRKPSDFSGKKIISMHFFGGELKLSVPY
jgi:hypothetical protein